MCWSDLRVAVTAALLLLTRVATAESDGFILGFGGEADTAGGRAVTVFGDLGVTNETWLSAMLARTTTGSGPRSLDTIYGDLAIDHWFEPVGIRVAAAYWGDDEVLDSSDLRASIYFRNDSLSISADYERRNFDLTIGANVLPRPRVIEFYADGYGAKARLDVGDATALSIGGMGYSYSRDINLQPNVDFLRIFSSSRLGLMNSLLDYRFHAGIDWSVGLRTIDLRLERWQTAIDQGYVDSIGVGFLTPVNQFSDAEMRFSYDYSDTFGKTITFSVFYYFFGT
jgi:hypothetical protein